MTRRVRCVKCGKLALYRERRERKQRDGSVKVWFDFIHAFTTINIPGLGAGREMKSSDYCIVGDYCPYPRRTK